MSARPRALAGAAFALLVAVRLLTMAPDPWEWDEVLFTKTVELGFDLRDDRPHPPGYPLFIEAASVLTRVGLSPLRATTLIGTGGSVVAVAGAFALLVAVGTTVPFAVLGAALYAFVPSVWLHAGRPLSDGPASAAFLFACAWLVRSVKEGRNDLFAAGLLAAVAGFALRPQAAAALGPLVLVAVLAGWRRPGGRRAALATAAIGAALSAAVWLPAIRGSGGWAPFWKRIQDQAAYVQAHDTLSIARMGTSVVWRRWLVDPFGSPLLFAIVTALALGAYAFRAARGRALVLVLLFVPLVILTIPFSSLPAAPRYAVVLLPLPCALAALALEEVAKRSRLAASVAAVCGVTLTGALALEALPTVVSVATRPSPPVAAMERLSRDPELKGRPLVIGSELLAHKWGAIDSVPWRGFEVGRPMDVKSGELVVIADQILFGHPPLARFRFDDPLLRTISRARFLDVSLVRVPPGVGIVRASVTGGARWDAVAEELVLPPGGAFTAEGLRGPVEVRAVCRGAAQAAEIDLETSGGSKRIVPRGGAPVSFRAIPNQAGILFRLTGMTGEVRLGRWLLRPAR